MTEQERAEKGRLENERDTLLVVAIILLIFSVTGLVILFAGGML